MLFHTVMAFSREVASMLLQMRLGLSTDSLCNFVNVAAYLNLNGIKPTFPP